jgi:hypothetical protein
MSSDTGWPDPFSTIGGQRNGLCSAGWPGALFLISGLHTGQLPFTVDVHDGPLPIDDDWEDIVEVSYVPGLDVDLVEAMGTDLQRWSAASLLTTLRPACAHGRGR